MKFIRANRPLVLGIAVIVFLALWAAFRPELLFVNKHVDDPFPAVRATATSSLAPRAAVATVHFGVRSIG